MMKYYIFGDAHGYFDILKKALDDAGFDRNNPEHFLVSLGDLLDRGKQPRECLQFVNSLERKILIRGNHEDLMEEMIAIHYPRTHDLSNGTYYSAVDITGKNNVEIRLLLVNRYPETRPPMPRGAEHSGSEQANPRTKPATQPYTGPFALENHSVIKTANIIAGLRLSIAILLKAGTRATAIE